MEPVTHAFAPVALRGFSTCTCTWAAMWPVASVDMWLARHPHRGEHGWTHDWADGWINDRAD
eukprot:10344308-Alexandrium_andersonii.AAC.1